MLKRHPNLSENILELSKQETMLKDTTLILAKVGMLECYKG